MFVHKPFVVFMSFVLVFGESAFVDNLSKCSYKDSECLRNAWQIVMRDVSPVGISEYSIPPFDPYQFKDFKISILNILNMTLVDGEAKGIKDCVVGKIEMNMETKTTRMELMCDITIKGNYKIHAESPLIKNAFGGSTVHGDGKCEINIEKLNLTLDLKFDVKKKDDGEIYVEHRENEVDSSFEIGNMVFSVDNVYLGETEASALIVQTLNENWKTLVQTFGKPFLDKAVEIIYENSNKFYKAVPTKFYLTDDLSQYVTES